MAFVAYAKYICVSLGDFEVAHSGGGVVCFNLDLVKKYLPLCPVLFN